MRGEKFFVCCALFLSTYIALSSSAVTTTTTPQPSSTTPGSTGSTTPTKPPPSDPNTLECTVYNLTLKLTNATYDEILASPHSAEFMKLRTDFEVGILQVYDGYKPFIGVTTLRFSKAPDGKTIVHFVAEFKENGTHLPNLTKAITAGQLGKLTPVAVSQQLGPASCYKEVPPPVCQYPCPSSCAPSCYSGCCQNYQQTYYLPQPPPPPPPPPPPMPAACPNSCPSTCAPVGCTPACCNTVYNQPSYPYGKRHHAPKPEKGSKKHHIFRKRHRKY